MEVRKKEHIKAVKDIAVSRSEVARHVFESDHRVDFESMQVVERESVWRRRIIKQGSRATGKQGKPVKI